MKILSVYSIKGGVGKTAAAVNLAYQFSQNEKKTLLIDLDPQGATGFFCRTRAGKKQKSTTLINKKESLSDHVRASDYPNLDILPSKRGYRNLDLELNGKNTEVLRKNLRELKKEYDIVMIDCPPNITRLSENIFSASNFLLVPNIPTPLSARTLEQLLRFLKKEETGNASVLPFFSMADRRKKVHRESIETMRRKYEGFAETIIPISADIERMSVLRQPVQEFASSSCGGKAFRELGTEILKKMGGQA